jgi:hypothetical protein
MKTEPITTELTLKQHSESVSITAEGCIDCTGLMQLLFQLCVGAGYNASSVADAMYTLGIEHAGDAG